MRSDGGYAGSELDLVVLGRGHMRLGLARKHGSIGRIAYLFSFFVVNSVVHVEPEASKETNRKKEACGQVVSIKQVGGLASHKVIVEGWPGYVFVRVECARLDVSDNTK
jgi:hypothetical protein